MQFQVAHIEFDFEMEDDEFPSLDYQQSIVEETKQKVWEVDDELYLTDAISDCFGWCVDTIIYNEVWLLTMETGFDFPELETEWQDDILIPADDDYESEQHFHQFINSNTDY